MANVSKLRDAAERYVNGYLSLEVQAADAGPTDPQLASIVFAIIERVASAETGVIIDVGCGSGALLSRLLDNELFRKSDGWLYVGVDTEDNLDLIQSLARQNRISRRVEPIDLDGFYNEWPRIGSPQIVFCRNVFHELNIQESSSLLLHISKNVTPDDHVVIQDLMKFPVGEHRNACWTLEAFDECFKRHGFFTVPSGQKSPSGNAWFNVTGRRGVEEALSQDQSRELVTTCRYAQWEIWTEVKRGEEGRGSPRGELVEALDLELQLGALTRQLRDEGRLGLPVDPSVEKRIRVTEFSKRIDELVRKGAPTGVDVSEHVHFRERGEQLTVLENFLRSDDRIAVIHGGAGTGKTTLARRVLATRSYEKAVVIVDGRTTKSFWAFVEVIFSQVGLRLAPELLSVIGDTKLSAVEPALKQFMNAYAHRTILLYDNFAQVHDRDGVVTDQALSALLELWSSRAGAKIIFASTGQFLPANLQRAASSMPATVRVGRYGSDQTVINVLDDRFDRSAAGVQEYPASLLTAIDRHPLIASLAAQNLQKHGADLLLDQKFINELKYRLRDQLWNRLVDESTQPVLEVASQLRIAVPKQMLRHFASEDSIYSGVQSELLRSFRDDRWVELLAVLGLFRVRDLGAEDGGFDDGVLDAHWRVPNHAKISDVYRAIYREDDDPKWIRESYFHAILSGNSDALKLSQGLGKYYYDELVASADYAYKKRKDFILALELYEIARKLSKLNEQSEMRRASCLIRRNKRELGEAAYARLVERFPDSRGNKTSHVDALLYVNDFNAAADALKSYDLKPADDDWIAYEWGRTHLGNDRYRDAANIFRTLAGREGADLHYHTFYGRCLQYCGDFSGAERALKVAALLYPEMHAAKTALGTTLEQNDKFDEALPYLEPLFGERDDNIQAAASLIRIYRINGMRQEAASILRSAERNCPSQYREYLVTAKAEIKLMDRGLDAAVEEARSNSHVNAYSKYVLFRTLNQAAELADGATRTRILQEAAVETLEPRYRLNGLIQKQRLEIARKIGDAAFEAEVLAALAESPAHSGPVISVKM